MQYERTKILYNLLDYGADFEHRNAEGLDVLELIQRIMEDTGSDLRLEKEVVEAAMEKVRKGWWNERGPCERLRDVVGSHRPNHTAALPAGPSHARGWEGGCQVEGEIQTAKTCGVGGLLMTLETTPCLVSWRRVCGILHTMMVDKHAYQEVTSSRRRHKSRTTLPALLENVREIYEIGFDMIVGMAGAFPPSPCSPPHIDACARVDDVGREPLRAIGSQ